MGYTTKKAGRVLGGAHYLWKIMQASTKFLFNVILLNWYVVLQNLSLVAKGYGMKTQKKHQKSGWISRGKI